MYTIYSRNDDKVGYMACGRVASALPGQDQAFEVRQILGVMQGWDRSDVGKRKVFLTPYNFIDCLTLFLEIRHEPRSIDVRHR